MIVNLQNYLNYINARVAKLEQTKVSGFLTTYRSFLERSISKNLCN